jgi:hypothetical protein
MLAVIEEEIRADKEPCIMAAIHFLREGHDKVTIRLKREDADPIELVFTRPELDRSAVFQYFFDRIEKAIQEGEAA